MHFHFKGHFPFFSQTDLFGGMHHLRIATCLLCFFVWLFCVCVLLLYFVVVFLGWGVVGICMCFVCLFACLSVVVVNMSMVLLPCFCFFCCCCFCCVLWLCVLLFWFGRVYSYFVCCGCVSFHVFLCFVLWSAVFHKRTCSARCTAEESTDQRKKV